MNFVCLWYGIHEDGADLRDTFLTHINIKHRFFHSFPSFLSIKTTTTANTSALPPDHKFLEWELLRIKEKDEGQPNTARKHHDCSETRVHISLPELNHRSINTCSNVEECHYKHSD